MHYNKAGKCLQILWKHQTEPSGTSRPSVAYFSIRYIKIRYQATVYIILLNTKNGFIAFLYHWNWCKSLAIFLILKFCHKAQNVRVGIDKFILLEHSKWSFTECLFDLYHQRHLKTLHHHHNHKSYMLTINTLINGIPWPDLYFWRRMTQKSSSRLSHLEGRLKK